MIISIIISTDQFAAPATAWLSRIGATGDHPDLRFDISLLQATRVGLMFIAPGSWAALILLVIALVTLGPYIERRLGSLRYLLTMIGCHLVGIAFTLAFSWLVHPLWPLWAKVLRDGWSDGSLPAFMGTMIAASGGFNRLWRGRIRWAGFAGVVTLMLYNASTGVAIALGAMLLGLILGRIWWSGQAATSGTRPQFRERRILTAIIVACASIGPIVSAWAATADGPLGQLVNYLQTGTLDSPEERVICRLASAHACSIAKLHHQTGFTTLMMSVLPSLMLLIICIGLSKGRRSAWIWAVLLDVAMGVTTIMPMMSPTAHLIGTWHDDELSMAQFVTRLIVNTMPALVPIDILILLIATGGLFTVRLDHQAVMKLVRRYGLTLLSGAVVFIVCAAVLHDQWQPTAGVSRIMHDTAVQVFGFDAFFGWSHELEPQTLATELVANLTGPLMVLVFLIFMIHDMRQIAQRSPRDDELLRQLIMTQPGGLFSWMAQWRGTHHWFSDDHQAAVAYRASHGVALTVGEPIGNDSIETAHAFDRYCDRQGLTSCYYSVGEEFAQAARHHGWYAMQIAEESRIPLGSVAFKGKKFQDVRTAMNRAKREGIRVEWTRLGECDQQMRTKISHVVQGWQDEQALPQMGFTLGGFREMDDPEVRTELALDEHDAVHAVLSWLPLYRDGEVYGWLLDVMRHSEAEGTFRSAIELLIGNAALTFQDEGYQMLSLSGSPLAQEPREEPPVSDDVSTALSGVIDSVAGAIEPYYSFTSLHHFKAKFGPEFHPLYLVYQDPSELPAIGQAMTNAYLTDETDVKWGKIMSYLVHSHHRDDTTSSSR